MPTNFGAKLISVLSLISGLSISAVAVYYSVAGLLSIFAASPVPIMVMGIALEVSKLIATVWLKQFWTIAPRSIKIYLSTSIVVLMIITSIGIFGYLSKAHLDQAVPTGSVVDKLSLIDERIKTQKENIEAARKALTQMDISFDQTMARSTSEQGASKAVQLRKSQAKERAVLQNDIMVAQTAISKLNDERAPIASELRKVEAEVGPIKYIAALIYGDNLDSNLLERAVRWMIILIVIVFDPLAVVLLLASQHSFRYLKSQSISNILVEDSKVEATDIAEEVIPPLEEIITADLFDEPIVDVKVSEGDDFPKDPVKGDYFTRIDFEPKRNFMFDGSQWVDADK